MTITLSWWMIPLLLIAVPFVYGAIRQPCGDYDFAIDTALIGAVCWFMAVGIVIGKLFFGGA